MNRNILNRFIYFIVPTENSINCLERNCATNETHSVKLLLCPRNVRLTVKTF